MLFCGTGDWEHYHVMIINHIHCIVLQFAIAFYSGNTLEQLHWHTYNIHKVYIAKNIISILEVFILDGYDTSYVCFNVHDTGDKSRKHKV